jgi:GT2 family glycosyltransferase
MANTLHAGKAPPRVAVVVLHWNSLADTLACLASLRGIDYPTASVIVVDNGSTDGPDAALRTQCPDVKLHVSSANLGYTGGNNLAIRAALSEGAEYVWLLNSDATVSPDTLSRLVAAAEADPRVGLVSPLIVHGSRVGGPGDRYDFAGGLIDMAGGIYEPTDDPAEGQAWQKRHPERFMLCGTALLLRRAVIERMGLLDDRFFAYWEDTDYAWRSLAAGFRNQLVFDATVLHAPKPPPVSGQLRPHFYCLMARNEILFWRKHLGDLRAARPVLWAVRRQLRLAAAGRQHPEMTSAIMAGLWDGLRGRGGRYEPARRMPAAAHVLFTALSRRVGAPAVATFDGAG